MNLPLRASPGIRELSAFYTPPTTAASLAQWAVRTGRESVLEPSFGGGALIEAAFALSAELTGAPSVSVVGVDVNATAVRNIRRRKIGRSIEVHCQDFLEATPTRLGTFDAILSNPPFTRNHSISPQRRAELRSRFDIAGAAGLWVHFILHSLAFLKEGGRIAFVIPASGLFTNYGEALLRRLGTQFSSIEVLRLNERPEWIGGAEEGGAFLLAEGYRQGTCLQPLRGVWIDGRGAVSDFETTSVPFAELALASRAFGEIAELSIGAVTGCNRTFLLSEKERVDLGIARADVAPIASRARQIRGVLITKRELQELALSGEKTWLLSPRELGPRGSAVRSRLAEIGANKRRTTAWLNKRDPWWMVDRGLDCDAVFSYMNDQGPRLARATPGLTCTNTLHRVRFRPDASEQDQAAAVLTMVSTFGQLAGERLGRVYGGGVLKFELRDARQLPVLYLAHGDHHSLLQKVDAALRTGEKERARAVADEALLPMICGSNWQAAVEELLSELRERRKARRSGLAS
jgi:adenine-specific DNA-methyltransferase